METAALESRKSHGRSRVTNGNELFVEPTDRRTAISRRFRDILSAIVADLGGADKLSEAQRQLARRVALMSMQCENMEAKSVGGGPGKKLVREIISSACQRRLVEFDFGLGDAAHKPH